MPTLSTRSSYLRAITRTPVLLGLCFALLLIVPTSYAGDWRHWLMLLPLVGGFLWTLFSMLSEQKPRLKPTDVRTVNLVNKVAIHPSLATAGYAKTRVFQAQLVVNSSRLTAPTDNLEEHRPLPEDFAPVRAHAGIAIAA